MTADLRLCLATVTTESFVPGTLVMLHSFLTQNPWFTGDIVVIHRGLGSRYRGYLAHVHDRVQFLDVGSPLQVRVDEITRLFPGFESAQARFYSLEAFRLRGYDRVLFCDSDILFRRPVRGLFEHLQPLVACGDGPHYESRPREWRVPRQHGEGGAGQVRPYRNTFNSGVLLIGRELLTDEHYAGLLNLVDAGGDEGRSTIADQIVLNLYFAGRQHLVSATYNYLLSHRDAIHKKEGVRLTDAHVLHFNGPVKPWQADHVLHASQSDPAFIRASAFWFAEYVACLQRLHLQAFVERSAHA